MVEAASPTAGAHIRCDDDLNRRVRLLNFYARAALTQTWFRRTCGTLRARAAIMCAVDRLSPPVAYQTANEYWSVNWDGSESRCAVPANWTDRDAPRRRSRLH